MFHDGCLDEGDRKPPDAICTAHAKPASSNREFCVKSPTHEPATAGAIAAERSMALAPFNRATPLTTHGTPGPGEPPYQGCVLMVVVPDIGTAQIMGQTFSDVSDRRFQQTRIKGQTSCGEVPFQRLEFDSQGRTDKGTDLFAVRGWRRFCGCLIRNEDGRRDTDKETDHFGSGTVGPRWFPKVRQACSGGLKCRKSKKGRMARPFRWARPS